VGEAIGLLHPGEMGASLGAALAAQGREVLWAARGRSARTRVRAEAAGLVDAGAPADLFRRCGVVLSVCPPHAALETARSAAAHGFAGLYADANAVSPATAREIGAVVEAAGAAFVDGGIVGPPVRPDGTGATRLYLSGPRAREVAGLFEGAALEAIALDAPAGAASALKMAFAAYTKGTAALLLAIRSLARAEGVDDALVAEWGRSLPELPGRSESAARGTAAKAWRFAGEMREIAASFAAAGLPDGFHRAAQEIYARLEGYKDAAAPPDLAEVADALGRKGGRP
jgi:3-hydroxyisobutyrate dehydrogenase-like beta-hydroxyacid dehydrogenase